MANNNGKPKYSYTKVDDLFIIAQDLDDPRRVMFFWNPDHVHADHVQALMSTEDAVLAPDLERWVHTEDQSTRRLWSGVFWTDEVDRLIKTLAESFINLRFASPDRTQIVIQDTLWPEFPDGE